MKQCAIDKRLENINFFVSDKKIPNENLKFNIFDTLYEVISKSEKQGKINDSWEN